MGDPGALASVCGVNEIPVIRTVAELRAVTDPVRRSAGRIGLVATMGALHEGHLSLIRAAAAECDQVVVSIFVNPAQFNDPGDLDAYPRTEEEDVRLATEAGATVIFAPGPEEVYPPGFVTSVRVGGVSEPWEGAARGASHFDGVALVVAKLFGMVTPDLAWFGQKDAQQVAVVRRLVADLNIPTEIRVAPTVREPDGLAMSSRNVRLSAADREVALSLSRGLRTVADRVGSRESDAQALAALGRSVIEDAGGRVEYFAIVDPVTFAELDRAGDRAALAIVAAQVGGVRLIDNWELPRHT